MSSLAPLLTPRHLPHCVAAVRFASENESIQELVFGTFSNLYIHVLRAATSVAHTRKPEVETLWDEAERLKEMLFSVLHKHFS